MLNKHKLVHDITPRYTIFSLKENHVGFDLFEGEIYWQGVANYGLWVLTAVLALLVAVTIRALYLKATCLYPPERPKRRKIKTFVTWLSFICTKLSILALIALLMGYGSWEKFNNQLVEAPLHNSACTLIEKLGPLENKLRNLLKQGEASNDAATDVATRYEKPELMKEAPQLCDSLEGNLTTLTEPIVNATLPLKKLCLPEKKPSKIEIKQLYNAVIFGASLCLWTVALCFLILKSFDFRSTLIMTILCILSFIAVIIWGLVASVSFMGYLTVADFCYNPLKPATVFIRKLNAEVNSRLVRFYLDCVGKNPLGEAFISLKVALGNMTEDSEKLKKIFETKIISRHGAYAKDFNKELMESYQISSDIVDSKCPPSKKDFDTLVDIPCRRIFWSFATLFVMAMFITILLACFVVIAMQFRKFVNKFLPPRSQSLPRNTCPETCQGPQDPGEHPLYHMPPVPVPPADLECPPSCKAFPTVLRKLTLSLKKEMAKRAEDYACDSECDKIYLDEFGKPIPPECIVVTHKAVETENAYMCTKSASRKLRDEKLEKERARTMKKKSRRKTEKTTPPKTAETDTKKPSKITFKNAKANLPDEAGKSTAPAKTPQQKSPCVPACDQNRDGNCGFQSMRRNNSNVKDAYMGLKCTNCPCAQKKRSKKSKL